MAEGGGDEFSLGPFGEDCGLTILDLTNPVAGELRTLKNGLILEMIDHIPGNNSKEAADLLFRLAHPDSPLHESKPDSLRLKIAGIVKKRTVLRKNNKKALPAFLSRDFVPPLPPLPTPPPAPPVKRSYEELQAENEQIKKELKQMELEQKQVENELHDAVQSSQRLTQELDQVVSNHRSAMSSNIKDINKLTQEKNKLQISYAAKSSELDKVNSRVHTLREKSTMKSEKIKSLTKKVQRDAENTKKKVKKIQTLEESNKEMQQQDEHTQVTTERMEAALKERRAALQNLSQVKRRAEKGRSSLVAQNEAKITELQKKVKQSDVRIQELQQLNVLLEGDIIHTFEGGRFVNELRETIMVLLTECNVSMSKVRKVMTTVCKNLIGKIPDRLPSQGTLHRILNEAKFVAQTQIVELMEEGGDPSNLTGNTLHSDATTKFHRHYQGFQTTLKDGKQITIGLTEVGAGDADTYLEAFKHTISELAEAVTTSTKDRSQTIAKLVTSLKNTMGDQGPTNPQFNAQLKAFREDLLPKVVENWDGLSATSKEMMTDMGNFFCKMHVLVNFATEADKVLKINEADVIAAGRNQFAFGTESGAARLIRTTAKALTEHGCDMSGVASHWLSYLDELQLQNHLISYRANRFNVLFYDAAATYFHRHHIFDFISSLPDPNNLLKAVQYDIQQTIYLAQIRALGIIDKVITGPFWRLVEDAPNILALNAPLNHMLEKLKAWAVDATPILEGEALFDNVEIHKDAIYDELFSERRDPDFITYTQVALEMVITGMVLILERQAKDQLEGGKYFAPSQTLLNSAKNVPTTNNVSERDFAILDVLVRLKPAASCHSFETYLLWLNNKPSEWLDKMNVDEKNQLLDMARGRYGSIREQYVKRKEKLKQQHRQSLKAKQGKKEKQEQRSRLGKVAATTGVIEYGGVWTLDSLDQEVDNSEPEKRKAAIYAQLKYHRKVLNSKGHHKLFNKSSHSVEFSEETLKENLKTVLELNEITDENVQNTAANLQYHTQEETQKKVQSSKKKMLQKISEQRKRIKAKQQQTLLPQLLANPNSLVGKKCTHRCREEDGTVEWFSATVTDICTIKPNVINTEYDLIYDEYPDDSWTFPLLMDLKKGDLIIKL